MYYYVDVELIRFFFVYTSFSIIYLAFYLKCIFEHQPLICRVFACTNTKEGTLHRKPLLVADEPSIQVAMNMFMH